MSDYVCRTSQRWPDAAESRTLAKSLGLRPHRGHQVLVLNFRGAADTLECVKSLLDAGVPEKAILVVDNASGGEDAAQIAVAFPTVPVLGLPENLGYAGGNDVAMNVARAAGCQIAVILNNDTVVAPRFLDDIADFMVSHERVAVMCPKITWYASPDLLWYAGGSYSRWRGYAVTHGRREADGPRFNETRPVSFATGCAVAIRLASLPRHVAFVPEFFGYVEDAELSLYAASSGHAVVYAPVTWVRHKEGMSFNTLGGQPLRIRLSVRNTIWVARRYLRWYHWLLAGPRLVIGYLGRFVAIYLVRRDLRSLKALVDGLIEGLMDPLPSALRGIEIST